MEIQCLIFSFSRLKQFFEGCFFSYSCTMVTFDWETWHDGSQLLFLFRCDKHTRNNKILHFVGKKYVVLCHSYVLHCDWSCDKNISHILIILSELQRLAVSIRNRIHFSFNFFFSEKAVYIVICEAIIWCQSENRIK